MPGMARQRSSIKRLHQKKQGMNKLCACFKPSSESVTARLSIEIQTSKKMMEEDPQSSQGVLSVSLAWL